MDELAFGTAGEQLDLVSGSRAGRDRPVDRHGPRGAVARERLPERPRFAECRAVPHSHRVAVESGMHMTAQAERVRLGPRCNIRVQGQLDAAENTLLYAHHLRPDNPDPDKMLAQFFARRVTDLSRAANDLATAQTPAPKAGEPDKDGFYRVGGDVPAPRRLDNPKYPPEAQDVGIQGVVIAEISLNEQGTVTDIRIVQSVPLLDQAAIDAVHNWRYEPAMLNGRPVPAKMTVTVNFSLRK